MVVDQLIALKEVKDQILKNVMLHLQHYPLLKSQ